MVSRLRPATAAMVAAERASWKLGVQINNLLMRHNPSGFTTPAMNVRDPRRALKVVYDRASLLSGKGSPIGWRL